MRKTSQLLVVGVTALMSACSALPPEMALDSKVYSTENAGLVLGSLIEGGPYGTWISFRNVNSGKTYGWAPKDYYSAWLPAGTYEVNDLGSRRGLMGPYSKPCVLPWPTANSITWARWRTAARSRPTQLPSMGSRTAVSLHWEPVRWTVPVLPYV